MPTPLEAKALAPRANNDLCSVVNQASAIVGGKLYFAMGTYTFSDGNVLIRQRKLFSVPLTTSFPAHSLISSSVYNSVDLPSGAPVNSDTGIFMYTNTTLYFYEPEVNDIDNGTSIWTYNAESSEFKQATVGGGENVPYQIFPGGYASDPATGRMYYTGSYRNSQKRRRRKRREREENLLELVGEEYAFELEKRAPSRPWMQILDASRGDNNANWLTGVGNGPTLLYGTLQYVRYGKKGILVGFGGVDPDDNSQFRDPNVAGYRSMTEIFVFDIDAQKWYTVTATGGRSSSDIPDGRLNFCAGVSAAPDDSSFQITIYGGYKLSNVAATNNVHVLIIPTFQWLDVTPDDQSLGDGRSWGRQTPKCLMWNDAQMIVLGGTIQGNLASANEVVNTGSCNVTHPPLLVLDTTTFEWKDEFNPNRSYSQPQVVYELINGDWRGLNPNKAPPDGFTDPDLANIFLTTVRRIDQPTAFAATTPPDSTGTADPGNPNSPDNGDSGPKTAAIVGGVVGGVVGGLAAFALIVGLVWFFLKKRRQEPPSIPPADGTGGPTMTRFEKPELDGTIAGQRTQQQGQQELDGQQTFDPLKLEIQQSHAIPMELPGDQRPRVIRNGSNGPSVYELDSGQARGELPATTPHPTTQS
ncbi:hypothetical protein ABW20_dc0109653 [Dactylellina cionopaga]|nr:hypothetical protein ABW20_dc0109653 [Dactylellina cionopaga]